MPVGNVSNGIEEFILGLSRLVMSHPPEPHDAQMPAFPVRNGIVLITLAAACITVGCSSDPQPVELTPVTATTLISQRWSRDEMNHLTVSFNSDTLIACGVQNDLWKPAEVVDHGFTRNVYQLTEKGNKALFSIDLKESGKLHQLTLRGPYQFEVTNITPGSQPDVRQVEIHWQADWNKVPAELKTCVPKFELSGSQIARFKLVGIEWRFVSYFKPEDVIAAPPPPAPDPDQVS